MEDDPRYAPTLQAAAMLPDGTWDTLRAITWMTEALKPGGGLPLTEVQRLAARAAEEAPRVVTAHG
jgi:hypothetical protein